MPGRRAAEAPANLAEERLAQRQHVLAPFAQRRQLDREHVQAIEQVLAELPELNRLVQVAIGRRDDAGVGLEHARAAETLEFALLQHAQELRLRRQAHLADFVEKAACRPTPARVDRACC